MTTETVSLHSFCKDHDLAKTTVRRWLNENGYSTSDGLSPAALEAAIAQFCPAVEPTEPEAPAAAITPEVMFDRFMQPGQLAPVTKREIQLPQGFDPSAMVRFFDGVAGQATDTASLVAIADLALNAVEGAMDEKLQAQRAELTQAERDAQALAAKIGETKTRLQVKALESKMLAERQTTATQTAEGAFAELMSLGKPAAEPDTEA
jgi:hypothetical protein